MRPAVSEAFPGASSAEEMAVNSVAMWITTKDGFYSAVEHRTLSTDDVPDIMVRARATEDLAHLAERLEQLGHQPPEMELTPDADYYCRITIPRRAWQDYASMAAGEISYDSHVKEALSGDDSERYTAMFGCWSAMNDFQQAVRKREAT